MDVANPQGRNRGTAHVKKRFAAIGGGGGLFIIVAIIVSMVVRRNSGNSSGTSSPLLRPEEQASVRLYSESVPSVLSDSLQKVFLEECTDFFAAQLAPTDIVVTGVSLQYQLVNNGDQLETVLDVRGSTGQATQTPNSDQQSSSAVAASQLLLTSASLVALIDAEGSILVENLVGTGESLFAELTTIRAEEQE